MEKIVKEILDVEHEGREFRAEWVSYLNEGVEMHDHWLLILEKTEEGYVEIDDSTLKTTISKLLCAAKIAEIQEEFGLPSDCVDKEEIAEEVIQRALDGKWMGQSHYSLFYIDNLTEILGIPFADTSQIVYSLSENKIVGLNGFIIVPWTEYESSRSRLEEQTGHKLLELSDFGGWSCGHCYNHSDERGPAASEVECNPPEFFRKLTKNT